MNYQTYANPKVYVSVSVDFNQDGQMVPKRLVWDDGVQQEAFEIDKVLDVRPAYAARAGGQGDRYTIRISGKERYLYFEHNPDYGDKVIGRWFVERK